MNKKILIIPLFLTMLCGCSDNNDITTITDSNTSTNIESTTTTNEEVFNTIDIESVREKNINETVLIKGIV